MSVLFVALILLILIVLSSLVSVNQATIAVTTIFGKYQRILRPGLNWKVPLFEVIYKRISIQNRSVSFCTA